jgi:hypothetical protein
MRYCSYIEVGRSCSPDGIDEKFIPKVESETHKGRNKLGYIEGDIWIILKLILTTSFWNN